MIADDSELVEYLSALGNARRIAVLRALAAGETSVSNLAECIGISQPALSQHLNILRRHQLVKTRREAQTIYYSLSHHRSEKALALVNDILFPYGIQMSMFGFSDLAPAAA